METVAAVVGIVAALVGIVAAGITGLLWLKRRLDPYRSDYPTIELLALGIQSAFIAERFGAAATHSEVDNRESGIAADDEVSSSGEPKAFRLVVYRRRNAVIALLLDSSDATRGFAVTSCDPKFRPQVEIPFGTSIVLNKTKMADVELEPFDRTYSVGGSGGFGYFVIDTFYGQTTAANYRNVRWGQMYLCSNRSIEDELAAAGHEPKALEASRRTWTVNAVLISDGSVTPAGASNFLLDVEAATYRAQPRV